MTDVRAGYCLHPNECQCSPLAIGSHVEYKLPPLFAIGSRAGYCLHPNECQCSPGWTGANCSDPLCITPCIHGDCTAPGICTCQKNYHGTETAHPYLNLEGV
eukprot:475644-Prorocentrum_minimum.AAC.4